MTDYEEDSDGELPSIFLSQSSGVKAEFSMPPATELAAQREREAAAELELQKLRDAEAAAEAAAAARRRHDPGEVLVKETLSSGVSALEVSGGPGQATQQQVEELAALAARLPAEDAAFLAAYARALQDAPDHAAAGAVTQQVVSGVCSCVCRGAWAAGAAGACGAAAAMLTVPPAPRPRPSARRALQALLDRVASAQQVDALIVAARAGVRGAARRLAAHDAASSGARAGADRLAAALLAAAMQEILHGRDAPEPPGPPAPLSAGVAAAARGRWRQLPAPRQLLLLRCAARALAAGGGGGAGGELLAALAQPLPRAPPRTQLEAGAGAADLLLRHQVMANVAKLQLLFGLGRAQVDESREQVVASAEPEKYGDKRSVLDQDMIVKKELENETVSMVELEHDHVTIKADCENELVAQMAPGHDVPMEQEPTDAIMGVPPDTLEPDKQVETKVGPSAELEHDDGTTRHVAGTTPTDATMWGDPGTALDSKTEVENKVEPSTEIEHDDGTIQSERENEIETAPMEHEPADAGVAGAVEGDAMELEAGAPQRRAARRSPRLATRRQPDT